MFRWRRWKWRTRFTLLQEMSLLSLASFCQSGAEYPVTFFYITKIYIIIIGFQPIDSFWYVVKIKLNNFSLLSHKFRISFEKKHLRARKS